MSIQLWVMNWILRTFERPALAKLEGPEEGRARMEKQANAFREVRGVTYSDTTLEGISAVVAHPKETQAKSALLYFHGGGYYAGSPQTHRKLAARIADQVGMTAFIPDYRLSPENGFPAAYDDAMIFYKALIGMGYSNIAIAGDSAGGGLALAVLHGILAEKLPLPSAVVAMSPWTDLSLSSDSLTTNDATDVLVPAERMKEVSDEYLKGAPADDPRASPVYGDFKGAPPVLIQAAAKEALYDDSLRMADRLRECDVDVTMQTWDNTYHVWQTMHDRIPEATEAVENIGAFLRKANSQT